MKYFYDTEFIEDGDTIELISIGMVSEDGRSFYRINHDCNFHRASDWVQANVLPHLPARPVLLTPENRGAWRRYAEIGPDLLDFMGFILPEPRPAMWGGLPKKITPPAEKPELWGYYSAYDHVALCQLFGRMVDLPKGMPMYTRDLKQWCDMLGNPALPEQGKGEHDALADAHWNKQAWGYLAAKAGILNTPTPTEAPQ